MAVLRRDLAIVTRLLRAQPTRTIASFLVVAVTSTFPFVLLSMPC